VACARAIIERGLMEPLLKETVQNSSNNTGREKAGDRTVPQSQGLSDEEAGKRLARDGPNERLFHRFRQARAEP